MNKINIIQLKGLSNTPAEFTKGTVAPYVRSNYINKFKDRLADDLFGKFIGNKGHKTVLELIGDNKECLIIETDMFYDEKEIISAVTKANNDDKICTLFSTFYALDIDIISICLWKDELHPSIFRLLSPKEVIAIYDRMENQHHLINLIK